MTRPRMEACCCWLGLAAPALAWVILVPVLRAAHSGTHGRSCLVNMKQLGLAAGMYAQDWGDLLPPAHDWVACADDYLQGEDVFACPQSSSKYGYAMNASAAGLRLGRMAEPAVVALYFEADADRPDVSGAAELVTRQDRHAGALNWAFADGHAKVLPRGAAVRWKP